MAQKAIAETLGYLLAQICKAHRARAQELLSQVGLHTGQEMLLLQLWGKDGCTHSELAGELCNQPATVTRMVDRLAGAGLVQRQDDAGDRRVSRVYLTAEGQALQQPVEDAWRQLEEKSFANLTLEEQLLLRRLLLQVLENIGD